MALVRLPREARIPPYVSSGRTAVPACVPLEIACLRGLIVYNKRLKSEPMPGGIFLLDPAGELTEMAETAFAAGVDLQQLLARSPDLLVVEIRHYAGGDLRTFRLPPHRPKGQVSTITQKSPR
jgi:hypothetical protein